MLKAEHLFEQGLELFQGSELQAADGLGPPLHWLVDIGGNLACFTQQLLENFTGFTTGGGQAPRPGLPFLARGECLHKLLPKGLLVLFELLQATDDHGNFICPVGRADLACKGHQELAAMVTGAKVRICTKSGKYIADSLEKR